MEGQNFPYLKQKYFAICLGLWFRRLFIIAFQLIVTVPCQLYDFYKALFQGYDNKLHYEHVAVQDDSVSDDSEVANPVERDKHGDANNYNSSEEDGSDIITVASDNEENIGDQHLGVHMSQLIVIPRFTL